ncbi:MAG TPA: hypothetical protein VJA16_20395 [Thermoanaerobaculia bacterium]
MSEREDRDRLQAQAQREFFFLPACGPAGRGWLHELCDEPCLRLRLDLAVAMLMLREFDLEAGRRLLASIDGRLRAEPTGISRVSRYLRRWHDSTLAYLHYLEDDLASADTALRRSQDQVEALLDDHAFLLPMAIHCTDFVIQRARMARRRGHWTEAKAQVRLLGSILTGTHPYCVLGSGRQVAVADLRAFFASLPLDETARLAAASYVGDGAAAEARLEQIAAQIFALPDVVIPYP